MNIATITLILICISIFSQILLVYFVLKNFKKIQIFYKEWLEDSPQRTIRKIENNPLMDDVVEYTLNSGIECMVMPDVNDRSTLFARDKSNDNVIPITQVYQTSEDRNSKDYSAILKKMTDRVDEFKKNNPQAIGDINVKN
jgi:hypothetical protein